MKTQVFQRKTCRLCQSKKLEIVLKLKSSALADAYLPKEHRDKIQTLYPLELIFCSDCGYVMISAVVDQTIINEDHIYTSTSAMIGLAEHFKKSADKILENFMPVKGSLAVDIAHNDAILLKTFKRAGLQTLSINPSAKLAKELVGAGIEIWPKALDIESAQEIKQQFGRAQIITANNVYANIDNLNEVTAGIKALLAEDGVFIVESSYLGDLIEKTIFDFIYHEHLSYFSVKPLVGFFQRNGMEIIDIERLPTKGGSLRYTMQLAGGFRPKSPVVSQFTDAEEKMGLNKLAIYRNFNEKIAKAKTVILKLMKQLKAQGKTIVGYGASATTTTLLYHFELAEFLDCIVDDNLAKQHTYSPGYHLPVLPSEELYKRKPDYIFVFAWRFFDSIMKKHKRYISGGGHFIVPLPIVEVY